MNQKKSIILVLFYFFNKREINENNDVTSYVIKTSYRFHHDNLHAVEYHSITYISNSWRSSLTSIDFGVDLIGKKNALRPWARLLIGQYVEKLVNKRKSLRKRKVRISQGWKHRKWGPSWWPCEGISILKVIYKC